MPQFDMTSPTTKAKLRLESDGRSFVLLSAARITINNLLKAHQAGETVSRSLVFSWLAWLIHEAKYDIRPLRLLETLQKEVRSAIRHHPILITDGDIEQIPEANICVVYILSKPEDYEGGEHDGQKLPQGGALFYQPQDYRAFTPVTQGECKAYYFTIQ